MKISPLIKNNKTLIAVLAVTFVCACVMIFECLSVYGEVQDIMTQIEEEDADIQRINKAQNPNPVKESEKIIQANTEMYRARIRDIRRKFGNPYRGALQDFLMNLESSAFLKGAPLPPKGFVATHGLQGAADLGAAQAGKEPVELHYSEDEIRSSFVALYNEYYSERKNADSDVRDDNERLVKESMELFDKFCEKLIQPPSGMEFSNDEERNAYVEGARLTFEKAFYRFCQQIQENTIEEILDKDLTAAKSIFLDALGVPRTMKSNECRFFVVAITNSIKKKPSVIPGLANFAKKSAEKGNEGGLDGRIKAFTTNYQDFMPPAGNVVHVFRHYRILEDLFRLMRESNIRELVSVESPFSVPPYGNPTGEQVPELGSEYKKYTYKITIVSTVSEIREFVNQLHRAEKQNLVFDIQEISFLKPPLLDDVKSASDKVEALRKAANQPTENKDQQSASETEGSAGSDSSAQNGAAAPKQRSPEEIYADPEYGAVLLGKDELVQAVIRFDYILYIGELLRK